MLFSLFQNIVHFSFLRFIVFAMYLDTTYVKVYSKSYESRKVKILYKRESVHGHM